MIFLIVFRKKVLLDVQVLSLTKYLNVNTDRVIQSLANLLYLIGVSLKLLTVILTEKKVSTDIQTFVHKCLKIFHTLLKLVLFLDPSSV